MKSTLKYNLHNSSFRVPHKRSTTTLSENMWELKDTGVSYKTDYLGQSETMLQRNVISASKENLWYNLKNPRYYVKEGKFSEPALTEESTTYKTLIAALKKRNRPGVYSWREYKTNLSPRKAKKWVNRSILQPLTHLKEELSSSCNCQTKIDTSMLSYHLKNTVKMKSN